MEIIYTMPEQPHRLFVNFIHACPNACLFCVDFGGDLFYGQNLKHGRAPTADQIITSIKRFKGISRVREVFFCGIGEPLLRYQAVIDVAKVIRSLFPNPIKIGINTSGTYFLVNKNVDFVKHFDLIQISINAEDEEKYNQICRPKNPNTFQAVIHFLDQLKSYIEKEEGISARIELSVVDTSESQFIPSSNKSELDTPIPDFEKCQLIANNYGWDFKVKKLLRDFADKRWGGT